MHLGRQRVYSGGRVRFWLWSLPKDNNFEKLGISVLNLTFEPLFVSGFED